MRLTQANASRVEREKQSEQRVYQLERNEDLHRKIEEHEWSQREYSENQLGDLNNLVHEMATMVKAPQSHVTVPGILDSNTLDRQGAVALPQLQDIVESSQSQSQIKGSESSSSEVSTKGSDPQGPTEEKKKELDKK